MTISDSNQPNISLELEPTIIPKATVGKIPLLSSIFNTVKQPQNPYPLTVYPGEPGEVAKVKLENQKTSSVRLRVLVRGNFPELWCRFLPENSQSIANQTSHSQNSNLINSITIEIPAQGKWYGELWFDIPNDFIEDWQAIKSGNQEPSKLDWEGSIAVEALHSYDRESEPKLIEWIDFNLYVRPPAHEKYIGQLPELFQIRDFENRFISIFQQALNPIVNSFNSMWAYLDPLTCPRALLPFLAYWVGWTYQADWDIKQQRRLIRQAMKLYRWRGTRKGLRLYLHLYTGLPLDDHIPQEADKHISITENFSLGMVLGSSYLGIDTVLGGGIPYHFTVRLRLEGKAVDEQSVRRIIDSEKPAFCTYKLIIES